ncbi:hypothetical protein C1H46_021310 [Malus baccata]|uniref:Uncharacterized protein n=1 Tax=Malus baccata TaxID=106549 RepID=A0A540M2Y2_MALBA|nr:hypothetical protein C1H46_021310 [Malus baccata]
MEGYPQGNFGPYIRVDWSCRYYQGSIFPARQGYRARRLQGVPVYRGPTEKSVKRGKAELKRKLEEIMNQALSLPGSARQRRYQVISENMIPTFCIILSAFAELNLPLSSWFIVSQSPNEFSF